MRRRRAVVRRRRWCSWGGRWCQSCQGCNWPTAVADERVHQQATEDGTHRSGNARPAQCARADKETSVCLCGRVVLLHLERNTHRNGLGFNGVQEHLLLLVAVAFAVHGSDFGHTGASQTNCLTWHFGSPPCNMSRGMYTKPAPLGATHVALCIGNSKYANSPLKNARNDAPPCQHAPSA